MNPSFWPFLSTAHGFDYKLSQQTKPYNAVSVDEDHPHHTKCESIEKKSIPSHVQPLLKKNRDLSQQMQLQQPVFKYEHIGKKYIFSDSTDKTVADNVKTWLTFGTTKTIADNVRTPSEHHCQQSLFMPPCQPPYFDFFVWTPGKKTGSCQATPTKVHIWSGSLR